MSIAEAESYTKDIKIKLIGYTSTSKSFEKAFEFATTDCSQE